MMPRLSLLLATPVLTRCRFVLLCACAFLSVFPRVAATQSPALDTRLDQLVDSRRTSIASDLIRLAGIRSPSGAESERARAVAAQMRLIGLTDVNVDTMPNVTGRIRGSLPDATRRAIVFVATLDDLAPVAEHQRNAKRAPHVEGDRVIGPGTNTSSTTAAVLGAARALIAAGVRPQHDLVFAAVAQEETGLVGMKSLYADWKSRADAFVDVLGDGRSLTYGAISIHWWRAWAYNQGGHTLTGGLPNVNQGIARAVDRILAIPQPPASTRSVLNISMIHSGDVVNRKPDSAWFSIDIRALDATSIARNEAAVRAVLDSVSRETGTRFDLRPLQQTAGGQIAGADTSKLVRASVAISKALGMTPQLGIAGSSNLNVAIAGGTLAIGMGGERGGARAEPGEFADIPSMLRSAKFVARLAVAMGFENVAVLTPSRALSQTERAITYDVVIRGGTVIDGSGSRGVRADVGIVGNRITRVSTTPLNAATAKRVIDATGLIVAPGFIDLHAHLEPLLQLASSESAVRQGITLSLGGPDGGGPWPFGAYLDSADHAGLGMNVAYLAGHNTIRKQVMGTENRAPTTAELSRMKGMVAQAMREGAFGLSTGLRYVPGFYSTIDEVIALSAEAATRGGIYTSHLREEGVGLIDGVAEALEIGRRAKIPVVLTHHKAIGRQGWGKSVVTLHMVDSARTAGTDVMIDQYPYTASFTGLDVLVPPWALAGGATELRKRLADPTLKDSIARGIIDLVLNDRGGGDLRRVQFAIVTWDRSLQGKTLHDWATKRGLPSTPESAVSLILEGVLNGGAGMVYHVIDEADVKRIMAHPQTMIASDGRLTKLGDGVPHPRNYGTFPRVLGHYVRDEHVLTLPQAINKMTGMPAARLGLRDRGCVRDGCVADLTLFDAAKVRDTGTFTDPHHYPIGIPWVLVNGEPVIANGVLTAARPGRVLRHEAK